MDKIKRGFLIWLVERAQERTTAAGIMALGASVGFVIDQQVASALLPMIGAVLIFVKSKWLVE